MMNTQDTEKLQDELQDANSTEQAVEAQSVEIHVQGFTLFAETMK